MQIKSFPLVALLLCGLTTSAPAQTAGQATDAPLPAVAPPAAVAAPNSPPPHAGEPKQGVPAFRVGYVDLLKVAEKSSMGKTAKASFEARADKLKRQIDAKQKNLEKQKAALEAKLPTYTPQQRAAKIKEYEKKVDELRTLLQKAEKEMKPLQEGLLKDVYGKIEKAAAEYGAANGFSVIVEKKELLYLGKDIDAQDVTEALIKKLDGN